MDDYDNDNVDESHQLKLANACIDILSEAKLSNSLELGKRYRIECVSALALSHERKEEIYAITESNMKAIYIESGWGWRPVEKRNEFFHPLSRLYLIIDEETDRIAGFAIFRFEYDDEDEPEYIVLYLYELQIREEYRSLGLGAQIIKALLAISKHFRMRKVILTCFKCNTLALGFYTKQQFKVDKISPSCYGYDECYEILSVAS